MNARVAIVVVTYNSSELLAPLVASLPAAAGENVSWQLIIADNLSQDDTVSRLRQLAPECTIIEMGRNAGYAAGINAAVQHSGDQDAYLILNPDVRLRPGCIETLVQTLERTGVGIAVPRLEDGDGDLILSMRREPSIIRAVGDALFGAERAGRHEALGEIVSDPDRYSRPTTCDWAEGSTQLVSVACWIACGPWDERYFLYSEEADFDLRARDAGYATWYEPTAIATHLEGGSAESPGLWTLLQLNRVRMFRQRHTLPTTAVFWLATVAREASRSLLGKQTSRAALKALVDPRRLREIPGPHSIRR